MANKNHKTTSLSVHSPFYYNIFEPERKSLQKKLGIPLSQRQFTEYLTKCNAKITYPKKINNIFAPHKLKKMKLKNRGLSIV